MNFDNPIENQIAHWKRQFGDIFKIVVESEDEGQPDLVFYFKKPDMAIMSAMAAHSTTDPLKSGQIMFKNCLLNSDMMRYADDVEVFTAVMEQASVLVKKRKASSQKL